MRSRFVEDFVESAVAAGISQYVTLGAGLDSFAYRHPDLLERLMIFEVDHPFSQAWKRRRLEELDCASFQRRVGAQNGGDVRIANLGNDYST